MYSEEISHVQNRSAGSARGHERDEVGPVADLRKYQGAIFVDNQGTTACRIVEALEKAGCRR